MKAKKDKKRTGPEPDRVKLKGDWQDAVAEALKKKRPEAGWPSEERPAKKRKP